MARLPRLVIPGAVHHLVHRTVDGSNAFPSLADLRLFKAALQRSSREQRVLIHAYALRAHEVQLLATPQEADSLARAMQALARFYVNGFNRRRGRSGALWQGRFRAGPVGGAEPLLSCMRYIEQAGSLDWVSGSPEGAEASSAMAHVSGSVDPLLAPVPSASAYWLLGNTPFEREATYRALLEQGLPSDRVTAIEATTLRGWALGTREFLASIDCVGLRRAVAKAPGRPKRVHQS